MATRRRKLLAGAGAVVGVVALTAGPAAAHQCTNASKNRTNPDAGVQLTFSESGVTMKKGLEQRVEKGIVDFDTGEGFHGQIGIDFDGDGVADASTFIVGPNGEIPMTAQENGSPDHGIVTIPFEE